MEVERAVGLAGKLRRGCQSSALDQIANNLSALALQLKGVIAENRDTLKPALDKLNGVLAIVDNRKERVQKALVGLNRYALGLGESVGSGPFFKAYIPNLLPGQWLQPFIDAAFSDLGVDPNVKLPSENSDPQVGQPGTHPAQHGHRVGPRGGGVRQVEGEVRVLLLGRVPAGRGAHRDGLSRARAGGA